MLYSQWWSHRWILRVKHDDVMMIIVMIMMKYKVINSNIVV